MSLFTITGSDLCALSLQIGQLTIWWLTVYIRELFHCWRDSFTIATIYSSTGWAWRILKEIRCSTNKFIELVTLHSWMISVKIISLGIDCLFQLSWFCHQSKGWKNPFPIDHSGVVKCKRFWKRHTAIVSTRIKARHHFVSSTEFGEGETNKPICQQA